MSVNIFPLSSLVVLNFVEWLHMSCVCEYNSISFAQKLSFREVFTILTDHKKLIKSEGAILFYL